ncbi:hypothetical protein F5Y00DRAFT_274567 [Daldinia vernicosa]|uniref:uncharacterized protein n=1 Tax=Daldinia vernicosa TaxID=114800 RepID=UPI0020079EA4|nr:uncharacterized protein F5Y00DRAFT_274567 [Daldinia vernicosa]KAI0851654.1 hypothetical protein F5Y00DRAFT_274567 [Daldinia vernicosa]
MSSFEKSPLDSTGDIWLQHKHTIERLYAVENKTAEEVMEIMEREFGCPRITKKAFQKIIRNKLKLSKRLKKGDWPRIYRNYLIHRKDIPTVVYHKNRKIIWKDVIKETKRSGPLPDTGQDGDATLPMDVVLRTPSPTGSRMSHSPATDPRQSTGSSSQPSTSSSTAPVISPPNIENALNGIPWVKFNYRMFSTTTSPHDSNTNFPVDIDSLRTLIDTRLGIDSFRIWKAAFPSTRLHFLSSMPSSSVLTPDICAYHLLAKVVYLASNNLHCGISSRDRNLFTGAIQLLSSQIPEAILDALFQGDLTVLRIIWEHLTECAGISRYHDTFTSLIKAGLQHRKWILPNGALYLSFAASMGALDVVQDLLDIGIRADDVVRFREYPVIVEAAATGNIECVQLLLRACDANREIIHNASSFQILILAFVKGELRIPTDGDYPNLPGFPKEIRSEQPTIVSVSLKNESQRLILKMVLDCGANVDLPWVTDFTIDNRAYDLPGEWCSTTLEKTYYWDKSLFSELAPYSTGTTGHLFQPDICISALRGEEPLREYVYSQPEMSDSEIKPSLELVLFQQVINDRIFDIEDVHINIDIIRRLLELGVDPNLPSLKRYKSRYHSLDIDDLLRHLVLKPDVHRLGESFDIVLRLILQSGASINSDVLVAGVQKEGIDMLKVLKRVGADVGRYGAAALSLAARFDNYDAVNWLLDSGVNINAEVTYMEMSVIALASYTTGICCPRLWVCPCKRWELSGPASCEMFGYLVSRDATLRHHPDDPDAFRFLYHLLERYVANGSLLNMMGLFLPKLDLLPPDNISSSLWEACLYSSSRNCPNEKQAKTRREKIKALELLLNHGLLDQDDIALSNLIRHRGPPELIERLLESCINPNAQIEYFEHRLVGSLIQLAAYLGDKALVEKLLQKGADINQQTDPLLGKTALRAACDWKEVPAGEEANRVNLIQFLIEEGADINTPGSMVDGFTALQCAVAQGNMDVVLLLIYEGASINTPDRYGNCALDLAAYYGRLDIVHLLLNVGALSSRPGQTGYDGAIETLEEEEQHPDVANLIRRYAEEHPRDD